MPAPINRFQTNQNDFSYLNGIDEAPPHAPAGAAGNPGAPPAPTPPPAPSQSSQRNQNFSKGVSEAHAGAVGGGLMSSVWGAAKSAFKDVKGVAQEGAPEIEGAAEDVAPELAAGGGADAGLLILAA